MPIRLIIRDASTEAAMMPIVMGKNPTPVRMALQPRTFCRGRGFSRSFASGSPKTH